LTGPGFQQHAGSLISELKGGSELLDGGLSEPKRRLLLELRHVFGKLSWIRRGGSIDEGIVRTMTARVVEVSAFAGGILLSRYERDLLVETFIADTFIDELDRRLGRMSVLERGSNAPDCD
jgi:hypothetical protein